MAITNRDRVGNALELLAEGLAPFAAREVPAGTDVRRYLDDPVLARTPIAEWRDPTALLRLMWEAWNDYFARTLGRAERTLVNEIRDWRNKWAHNEQFASDDADRALDSIARLLGAVSASQADDVNRMKLELRRLVFDEQVRNEKRKAGGTLIEAASAGVIKPWREVVTPHADVASGRYQQAEFAADLWQVHLGEGSDEYLKPEEFFRRTFLTESLRQLLVGGVRRLSGQGGDPVVQLQTNFGGGKTHSMLALYHLVSGTPADRMPGVDAIVSDAGVDALPRARVAVLVGTKISPGSPVTKPDGTVVRTLWGELAYQLGGAEALARIAADDANATSPGDALRALFNDYGPCLVLIDEWVAYARQLHDAPDLPGGTFETQFTFAQALTEAARAARNCLLVISLPASDTGGASPHAQADDVEVGGIRGREALDRLRNVVGRVESSWRPASAEEGFEIVRRRLFEPLAGDEAYRQRNVTAQAFAELYQSQKDEFPSECRTSDYERRIQAAYPIHPEIFDRLYTDWSTLVKFQRTRGVLRLMAAVIHSLWEKGDRAPLILPSTVPIDDPRVQFELTRYLSDNWVPILEKDVDGPSSLPLSIDGQIPNLGKFSATRRVARTIYLGSAPTADVAQRGIEDRRVTLGCAMPGERPEVFGDALRRLAAAATYLYQEGTRYWYSTQPTVTKLADDRAQELTRKPDLVHEELVKRLELELGHRPRDDRRRGDFAAIYLLPRNGADVPDDLDTRLVVLDVEQPYVRGGGAAEAAAKAILESRGSAPRLYRNTLVYLAADSARVQDLQDAIRRYLAWQSILVDKLELTPSQVRQAQEQRDAADSTVVARLPETYQWLLTPSQSTPSAPLQWLATRLSGADGLAARASRRLKADDLLVATLGPTIVRKYLDEVPLWRGKEHVAVRQLVEDFAQQLYLPRVAGPAVLADSLQRGVASMLWEADTFAYAESFDETAGRYRGLRAGELSPITRDDIGLVVQPQVARHQIDAETAPPPAPEPQALPTGEPAVEFALPPSDSATAEPTDVLRPVQPRRYHATVRLDPARLGRDAGQIGEEVLAHLAGMAGAEVTVTLDIAARFPGGASEQVVRTVTENGRTLRFEPGSGFEQE